MATFCSLSSLVTEELPYISKRGRVLFKELRTCVLFYSHHFIFETSAFLEAEGNISRMDLSIPGPRSAGKN